MRWEFEDFMIDRIVFTIVNAFKHSSELKKLNKQQVASLPEISVQALASVGLLILDFDGVMANHGEPKAFDAVVNWCHTLHQARADLPIYILTNNPFSERSQFFATVLPFINVEPLHKKKPYPEGVLAILAKSQVAPNQTLLIDDRLLTGGLAAILSGIDCWIIEKPFMDFRKRPIVESFFWGMRKFERTWFR